MAFRFRRSIKIAPGIRINLNKKSTSVRIGPRGLGYTINSKGQKRVSAGIPGTGLSYSKVIPAKPRKSRVAPERPPIQHDINPLLTDDLGLNPVPRVAEKSNQSRAKTAIILLSMVIGLAWCANHSSEPSVVTRKGTAPRLAQPSVQQTAAVAKLSMLFSTANVRLRSGPSTETEIILTVPAGSAVISKSNHGPWHQVTYNNQEGWIHGNYLTAQKPSLPKVAPATPAPLVAAPARTRTVQRTQPASRSRYIRGPRGGCYYINRNGNKTYVDRSLC